jgi:hypothetical protein
VLRILVKGEVHTSSESELPFGIEIEKNIRALGVKPTVSKDHIRDIKNLEPRPDVVFQETTGVRKPLEKWLKKNNIPTYDVDVGRRSSGVVVRLALRKGVLRMMSDIRRCIKIMFEVPGQHSVQLQKLSEKFDVIEKLFKEVADYEEFKSYVKNGRELLAAIKAQLKRDPFSLGGETKRIIAQVELSKYTINLSDRVVHDFPYDLRKEGVRRSKAMYEEAMRIIKERNYRRPYMIVGKNHAQDLKDMHPFRVSLV